MKESDHVLNRWSGLRITYCPVAVTLILSSPQSLRYLQLVQFPYMLFLDLC